jgi:hypothetical protein
VCHTKGSENENPQIQYGRVGENTKKNLKNHKIDRANVDMQHALPLSKRIDRFSTDFPISLHTCIGGTKEQFLLFFGKFVSPGEVAVVINCRKGP